MDTLLKGGRRERQGGLGFARLGQRADESAGEQRSHLSLDGLPVHLHRNDFERPGLLLEPLIQHRSGGWCRARVLRDTLLTAVQYRFFLLVEDLTITRRVSVHFEALRVRPEKNHPDGLRARGGESDRLLPGAWPPPARVG